MQLWRFHPTIKNNESNKKSKANFVIFTYNINIILLALRAICFYVVAHFVFHSLHIITVNEKVIFEK